MRSFVRYGQIREVVLFLKEHPEVEALNYRRTLAFLKKQGLGKQHLFAAQIQCLLNGGICLDDISIPFGHNPMETQEVVTTIQDLYQKALLKKPKSKRRKPSL